jgi:hypothetical protein
LIEALTVVTVGSPISWNELFESITEVSEKHTSFVLRVKDPGKEATKRALHRTGASRYFLDFYKDIL